MKTSTKKKIGEANSGAKSGHWKGGSKSTDALNGRRAWEKATGKKIPKGYMIHHKDGDPTNDNISNLKLVRIGGHNTIEKKGKSWRKQGEKVNKPNTGTDAMQRKYR